MGESRYLPGLLDALERVNAMELAQLLSTIDALYGRDTLAYGATTEDVRAEALRQVRRDFENPAFWNSPDAAFIAACGAAARSRAGEGA